MVMGITDHLGKRFAEHGNRRGEDQPGTVRGRLPGHTDGFEQIARAIEVNAVALLEICLASPETMAAR